jgi:predicted GIY-YIG superfamily endonuclease
MSSERVVVYRCYDESGVLLYIGATYQLKERLKVHARTRPEWHRVTRVDEVWYETRAEALAAESAAIAAERPEWNCRDHPDWYPAPKPREPGDWLTTAEAGRLIGRTQFQIVRLIEAGVLPYKVPPDSRYRWLLRTVLEEYRANCEGADTYGRHAKV